MPEDAPQDQHERQQLLQRITAQVTADHSGADVDVVRDALSGAIAEHGFPEQPQKWVDDTAGEISQGRHVVVDRELGIDNELEETQQESEQQIEESR